MSVTIHYLLICAAKASNSKPTLKCDKRHRITLGQPLLIECMMDLGNGHGQNLIYVLKWKKVGIKSINAC